MNPNLNLPSPIVLPTATALPAVQSTLINPGWLAYWDTSANVLKPMSAYVGSGTAATDRKALAKLFAGAFTAGMIVAQTQAGYPGYVGTLGVKGLPIVYGVEYTADCAAGQFEPGDLVGVVSSGAAAAGAIGNTNVVKVTLLEEAIGMVRYRYSADTTRVRVLLFGRFSGISPLAGIVTATGAAVVGAAASDAGTTQTLANNLRTALINLGLAKAS